MGIQADNALAMIDINHIATEKEITGIDHGAICGGFDRRAFIGCDVQTAVWPTLLFIKKTP